MKQFNDLEKLTSAQVVMKKGIQRTGEDFGQRQFVGHHAGCSQTEKINTWLSCVASATADLAETAACRQKWWHLLTIG